MRVLWVVTKPPWPARDGGRLIVANTLRALAAAGHDCLLVSPFDPAGDDRLALAAALRDVCEPHLVPAVPRRLGPGLALDRVRGVPITVARHALAEVTAEVSRIVRHARPAVVHAEQLQALAQCVPARRLGLPVVLRSQNVESDLWAALGTVRPLVRAFARWESACLAHHEARALREVAATVALTERDADRLRALSGRPDTIHRVAAPFPDRLASATATLAGDPPVVVIAGGWLPNRDGAAWFHRSVWREVRAQCPGARLHLFGAVRGVDSSWDVAVHAAPVDSRQAFPPHAIVVVPLRIASGVRVKILEAWARGLPVVATREAAAGLDAADGRQLLIANDAAGFGSAIRRLHADPALARACVEAGRALLRARHDPARIATQLAAIYADLSVNARR